LPPFLYPFSFKSNQKMAAMGQGDLPDWLDVPASEVLGDGSEGL